jgi:DNA-binding MarR family transcriptional regulator
VDQGHRWLTDEEQATWRSWLATQRLVHEALERQLSRDHGMPQTYYLILAMLSETASHEMTLTQLARSVGASPSRLSHALNRLEGAGWVARRPHATDRRTTLATLTEPGHAALREAAPGHVAEVIRVLFSQLGEDQVKQLKDICDAVNGPLMPESDSCPD